MVNVRRLLNKHKDKRLIALMVYNVSCQRNGTRIGRILTEWLAESMSTNGWQSHVLKDSDINK